MERRTKIVATLGPASDTDDRLRALIAAGVDAVRLNLSHGTRSEVRDAGRKALAVPQALSLEFRDVEFGYGDEKVLDRLTLAIDGGKKVGLIGRTGCGKSTLLKLVERMYDANGGAVMIGGEDVRRWPLKQLRRVSTCMSQNGGVFFSDATLLDTIRFAKPEAPFSDVMRAAKLACIHDEIMGMQDGYQTKAGEHGKKLSGGQRQRVAIAQAILSLDDPAKKIVLLDECTSNLDAETEAVILNNVWPLMDGKTVLVVTHRVAAIEGLVDEVVALSGGRVACTVAGHEVGAFGAQLEKQLLAFSS